MDRRDAWPLGAIGFILAVTAAWWGLALWSVPGAPDWLDRARSVCFNITETGLPDAKGWLLLLGQPPAMLAVLLVGWFDETRASVGRLLKLPAGRAAAVMAGALLLTGASWAIATVREARASTAFTLEADEPAPETYPRLDRPWPEVAGLVDQSGAPFSRERLAGRPALVTFAFGNCRTVCPAVVHQARQTRLELAVDVAIVVYTLDPWRDTPTRLPALTEQLMLNGERDHVVSGPIADVERALDAWGIPRTREGRTGDITHPALVYLVESDGTIAYGSTGGPAQLRSLAERLRSINGT